MASRCSAYSILKGNSYGSYLGGIKSGALGKIMEELELTTKLKIKQFDPTDKIVMPNNVTYIRANPLDTVKEFKKSFPSDKANIEKFFRFIMNNNFLEVYKKVKKVTFSNVLDEFFDNHELKATIDAFVAINTGLTCKKIAGVVVPILFRSYMLDPGYYPLGGMQSFPNALVDMFKRWDGEIVFSKKVEKIITDGRGVTSVLYDNKKIKAKLVVSNVDASQLFNSLLDVKCKESSRANTLIPSISAFAVYMGLDCNLKDRLDHECGLLYFSSYNIKESLNFNPNNLHEKNLNGVICEFPSLHDSVMDSGLKSAIGLAILAKYHSKKIWDNCREELATKMIDTVEKILFPLGGNIKLKLTGTPNTFYRYTLNREGAAFGWASTLDQIGVAILPPKASIKGLYLTGHWCTVGFGQGGVSGVALSGRKTAELILRDVGRNWKYELLKP